MVGKRSQRALLREEGTYDHETALERVHPAAGRVPMQTGTAFTAPSDGTDTQNASAVP